jgi:hypothetical protein
MKKIISLSCSLFLASISMSTQAELYTNFYNNSREAVKITQIKTPSHITTNAEQGIEIKPQPNGYPPHIWFKVGRYDEYAPRIYITITSVNSFWNFCRFSIPYNASRPWSFEGDNYSGPYLIQSFGDFHCYLKNMHDNTAHLNIDRI